MALIILEGMDNTGKTTTAKLIANHLCAKGYTYVSGGGPEAGTADGAMKILQTDLPDKVQDRTFISELIYGPILRGQSGINTLEAIGFMDFLKQNNAYIFYTRRGLENILTTFDERDQLSGVKENAEAICQAYDRVMFNLIQKYGIPVTVYNFDTTKVGVLLGYIDSLFETEVLR